MQQKKRKKSWAQIAKDKNMNEATVRTIYRNKDKIRTQGEPHMITTRALVRISKLWVQIFGFIPKR